jgi:hypothetical protein
VRLVDNTTEGNSDFKSYRDTKNKPTNQLNQSGQRITDVKVKLNLLVEQFIDLPWGSTFENVILAIASLLED